MSIIIKVITPQTVSGVSTNVYARKMMDFVSNSVVAEIPKLFDLGLSPAITTDKLKSVIVPATRVEGLTDSSNRLAYMHGYEKVTVGRVSEAKEFSDYIKNNEFETMEVFERENNSRTRINSGI